MTATIPDKTFADCGFYQMFFTNRYFYDVPVSLLFDNKIMSAPDAMIAGKVKTMTIHFSGKDPEAKFLYPVDNEQRKNLTSNPDNSKIKIKVRGKFDVKYFDI